MRSPKETTSNSSSTPKSLFSPSNFRILHSLLEKQITLFRTWFLIVYHPREFFTYYFGSRNIKLDSTIFLGVLKFNVNTEQHKILDPSWFIINTSGISVFILTIIFYLSRKLDEVGHQIQQKLPIVTEFEIANDFIISTCIVAIILLYAVLLAIYIFVFCKKGTSLKKLVDFCAYLVTAYTLSFLVGFSVVCFLSLLMWNNFPVNQENDLNFSILFAIFGIYFFVFVYMFLEVFLRIFVANVIIVLREILRQELWRIAFIFGIPAVSIAFFFSF